MKNNKFISVLFIFLITFLTSAYTFEVSVSPNEVSLEKPSGMSFNNVLIQKTAGKELKELKTTVEEYLTKMDSGDDEYIYNNMLHPEFHKQYSLADIVSIHNKIRTIGKFESCDFNKARISIKRDALSKEYSIVFPVKYDNGTEKVTIDFRSKDNVLKIVKFKFNPI